MGKVPYMYTDSDETEDTSSSVENLKKKKKFSILKYTIGNVKKKSAKCKVHSMSEPDETEFRSRSNQRIRKLRGILKHDRERETSEDDELEPPSPPMPPSKYLVGRVPQVPGSRPGRGGGVAIVIRKNTGLPVLQSFQAQGSTSSTRRRRSMKRLSRKRSY